MNIWCDVCSKKKASVFCSADEAALCDDCDSRVHHANKLASKHQRFCLLHSSSTHIPLCDICQEKKALFFCQEDRAILCSDCDVAIHTANEFTQKHSRFLLTGLKLTTPVSKSPVNKDSASSGVAPVPDFRPQSLAKPQPTANNTSTITTHGVNSQLISSGGGSSTSSISEYLIEILPGWQVEDLLDPSSDPAGFSKGSENLLFLDSGRESRINSYENMGLWVPQAPAVSQPSPFNWDIYGVNGLEMGKGELGRKVSRKNIDDGFTVPEISQEFVTSKRSRGFR